MILTGPDVSHHQGVVDWGAVARAGHVFAIVKASEGSGYTDPLFASNRSRAAAAGLAVGMYHYAGASVSGTVGDPHAEAAWFISRVGALQPGEFVVLDWEPRQPPADPVMWCAAWLKHVGTELRTRPLIYMNQSARDRYNWSLLIPASLLWLAKYDGSVAPSPSGAWPTLTMKQYTDRGACPGIPGGVDLNAFYGDHAALAALSNLQEADLTPEEHNMLAQIVGVLGSAYDGPGDDIGAKVKRLAADLAPIERYGPDGKTIVKTSIRQELANLSNAVAALGGAADPQAIAQPIIDAVKALPSPQAAEVADLVITGLGQRINATPTQA